MKKAIKPIVKKLDKLYGILATFPFRFRANKISKPDNVSHEHWVDYLSSHFNKPGFRVLELGSRNVTGANLRNKFSNAKYVGFDFYAGENVDVVGDAHKLSSYFSGQEKFDLIYSSAVFEHLHMPWVAAIEIQKLLKDTLHKPTFSPPSPRLARGVGVACVNRCKQTYSDPISAILHLF